MLVAIPQKMGESWLMPRQGGGSSDQHLIAVSPIDENVDPVHSMGNTEASDQSKPDLPLKEDHTSCENREEIRYSRRRQKQSFMDSFEGRRQH